MSVKIDKKILIKYLQNYSKLLEAEAVKHAGLETGDEDELYDKAHEVFEYAEALRENKEITFK
jgi:hypothetical protein